MNKVKFGGVYIITHKNKDGQLISKEEIHNLVPNEGLEYFNTVLFGGAAASSYYVGLYSNNYSVLATDTISTFITNASEVTVYDELTRPQFVPTVSGVEVFNSANKAVFTINDISTARGVFIATSGVKGGTAGKLISASLFASPRSLVAGDTLSVEYLFGGSSS